MTSRQIVNYSCRILLKQLGLNIERDNDEEHVSVHIHPMSLVQSKNQSRKSDKQLLLIIESGRKNRKARHDYLKCSRKMLLYDFC